MYKHGMEGTRLYGIWSKMKCRCSCKRTKDYKNYGARGIRVCAEWQEFVPFMTWALQNGYRDDLTLDRKDVNGDYCPSNCQWISGFEQQSNRRNNHKIEYNGEIHTIAEWARILGLRRDTLRQRIVAGWPLEKALSRTKRPYTKSTDKSK